LKIKTALVFFIFFLTGQVFSQSPSSDADAALSRLQAGIRLFNQGRLQESLVDLRQARADSVTAAQRAEILYWISLAELAAGEYDEAAKDMDALEALDPVGRRSAELPYHKGRLYYYLGRYNEAIVLLKSYSDTLGGSPDDNSRKSAALYWIGECLYSLGQMDQAADIFLLVINEYPESAKYEAASYRIALINQKKVETELLELLKWTHEESLKTMEEYQRREHSYDQALMAYQKRIADMLKDGRLSDLEDENSQFRQQIAEAEDRIQSLERELRESPHPATDVSVSRLYALRSEAEELQNEILKGLAQEAGK
jgi:TolA-binding protein